MLEIPPSAQFVGTARLFAAAIARHFGCDQEAVEDIKVAISESCTSALLGREPDGPHVHIDALVEGRRLTFEVGGVSTPARPQEWLADGTAPSPSLELVRALFPDAVIKSGTVRFWLELPEDA